MKRESFTADHLRDALPADPHLPDEFDKLLAAIDSGEARDKARAAFIEELADEELDRLRSLTDWARHELDEDRANPLFDPQPDYTADMNELMFDASGRPAMVARDWSDPDKRAGIDERLEEQRAEMEAQQRRWQEEWAR